MDRLAVTIFLLGLGLAGQVTTQQWTRSIENETYDKLRPNHVIVSDSPRLLIQRDALEREEEELLKLVADKSMPIDAERWNIVGDRMITRANVSEEAKRVVRQVKKERPGFFWTLFRVTFETVNETRAAIQQISDIVSETILPESATSKALLKSSTASADVTVTSSDSANTTTTTTEEPFKLTRKTLQRLVRRNVLGLARLFGLEWQEAVDQSQINIQEFQKSLGQSVAPFLADNPAVY